MHRTLLRLGEVSDLRSSGPIDTIIKAPRRVAIHLARRERCAEVRFGTI
jgi:hypothetical protein